MIPLGFESHRLDDVLTTPGRGFLVRQHGLSDLSSSYHLEFEDGSAMDLNHAVCLVDKRATIIKTEHMGDYVVLHRGSGILSITRRRRRESPVELTVNNLAEDHEVVELDLEPEGN